jgi:aromatic-L-amino-acid decarboxylase
LKLWIVIRAFGVNGIVDRLRAHIALANEFAMWVENDPDWVLAAPQMFSLVCFRYAPPGLAPADADAVNQRILDRVNASGRAYLSHTRVDGRFVLRLAIGNLRTERSHVAGAWSLLQAAAREGGTEPALVADQRGAMPD